VRLTSVNKWKNLDRGTTNVFWIPLHIKYSTYWTYKNENPYSFLLKMHNNKIVSFNHYFSVNSYTNLVFLATGPVYHLDGADHYSDMCLQLCGVHNEWLDLWHHGQDSFLRPVLQGRMQDEPLRLPELRPNYPKHSDDSFRS